MSRPSAEARLARLLALVPWVAAQDGPTIEEVCSRFGCRERELLADLQLLFLCGVYPFTPDTLIEVDVADGRVWIRYADYFRRPLRLTAPEGLALLGAGRGLLAVPGSDPDGVLARAVARLADVVGAGGDATVEVDLGPVAPEVLDTLRRAVGERRQVRLDYYSFGRDDRGLRVVDPWRVFSGGGQWYLAGHCHRAGAERLFRLDRIEGVEVLEPRFSPPLQVGPVATFSAGPDDPTVVLELQPPAHWIAEQYPNLGVVEAGDGRLRVTLAVSGPAWLARLLLRAGPAARVVEGDGGAATAVAGRLLDRYRGTG